MNRQDESPRSLIFETALVAVMILSFFWLLARFIESIYTFGLLSVDIPPEIASAAFLLSPLLLLIFPGLLRGPNARRVAGVTAALALLCSAVSLLLAPRERMLVSGLGTGLMLLSLPAALMSGRLRTVGVGAGLLLAGLLSQTERAFNHGSEWLEGSLAPLLYVVLALIGLVLLLDLAIRTRPPLPRPAVEGHFGVWLMRWLGLISALALLYFGFLAPTVVARWVNAGYGWVSALMLLSLMAFTALWLGFPAWRARLNTPVLVGGVLLFALALAFALLPYQLRLPADAAAYPFDAPQPGVLAMAALALALLLHPLLYAAAARLAGALLAQAPSPRGMAAAASLAALFFLVLIFGNVFTTVYDYIPVVGPLFRDRFGWVMVVPAVLLAISLVWSGPSPRADVRHLSPAPLLLFAAALLPLILTPAPRAPEEHHGPLRVITYNIQQGSNTGGQRAYAEQVRVVQNLTPDILGLQESDTARIANGSGDALRYFADTLGMFVYPGPNTVSGTFGIALLSRYPIEDAHTFFMTSEGEQTAAIIATVRVADTPYTVLVTHLGNGGPLIQQQQVLSRLAGQSNVIAMGDFNFRPSSEAYQLTAATLPNAWDAAAVQVPAAGEDLTRRIDHIFVSSNLKVQRATYLPGGPSDHPALLVEIVR